MKLLIIDLETILSYIHKESLNTQVFEIYYDITRLLNIPIDKESCFKLYAKHYDSYGKLRDYLSILGRKVDKKKFDDEFFRRYKQLYLNGDQTSINEKKKQVHEMLSSMSGNCIVTLIAITNLEFAKYMIHYFELERLFVNVKLSEDLNDYIPLLREIIAENLVYSNPPEETIFSIYDDKKKSIVSTIQSEFKSKVIYKSSII